MSSSSLDRESFLNVLYPLKMLATVGVRISDDTYRISHTSVSYIE